MELLSDSFRQQQIDLDKFKHFLDCKEAVMFCNEKSKRCWRLTFTKEDTKDKKTDFLQCMAYGYWVAVLHSSNSHESMESLYKHIVYQLGLSYLKVGWLRIGLL